MGSMMLEKMALGQLMVQVPAMPALRIMTSSLGSAERRPRAASWTERRRVRSSWAEWREMRFWERDFRCGLRVMWALRAEMVSLLFWEDRVVIVRFKDWEDGLVSRNSSRSRQQMAKPTPLVRSIGCSEVYRHCKLTCSHL